VVDVRVSGPVFDGRADAAVRDFCDEAERDIAAQGYSEWMTLLDFYIQFPTPYYETQITVTKTATGRVIHDRGVVYGPFLEDGTGKGPTERHAPPNRRQRPRRHTGRFRGYHAALKATVILDGKAPAIVRRALIRARGRIR